MHFMRPFLQTLWLEIRSQFSEVASWFWSQRSAFVVSLVLFGLAAFFTVPHDKAWVQDIKALWPDGKAFAKALSFWGDYPFIGLIPGLGLGIFGLRSQKRNLARFGLALLLEPHPKSRSAPSHSCESDDKPPLLPLQLGPYPKKNGSAPLSQLRNCDTDLTDDATGSGSDTKMAATRIEQLLQTQSTGTLYRYRRET